MPKHTRTDGRRRGRDLNQIQDDIKRVETTGKMKSFAFDDDLPGGGQFYCLETGGY